MSGNTIVKDIDIAAPVARVWQALVDHRQFGAWFRVALDRPFAVGQEAVGQITWPGYEHLVWRVFVVAIEPERRFAFTWHPFAVDPAVDYSAEEPTLVEFVLEPNSAGTHLTVTESGFEKIPEHRRAEAFLRNSGGWAQQVGNIRDYVAAHG